MSKKTITITVEMTDAEEWAFAQFLKRTGFSDYSANSENEEQTYLMRDAGDKVRQALQGSGYAPR